MGVPVGAAVLCVLMAAGCASVGGLTQSGKRSGARDCASCERMCEVAGATEGNDASIARCKAECRKSCS